MTDDESRTPRSVLLFESAAAARLIVCERTGLWAAALRRALGPAEVRVQDTRTVPQAFRELRAAPAGFLVIARVNLMGGW